MADGCGLELGRPDALAGDVQRVVRASVEEPVAVLVDGGPVAVGPDARESPPVRLQVALRVAPDPARHARPRAPADELADLAANRPALVVDDVDVLAERGKAYGARLRRLQHRDREEAGAHLGPAGAVDDRDATAAAHVLVEPVVRPTVPRLTCGQHANAATTGPARARHAGSVRARASETRRASSRARPRRASTRGRAAGRARPP